MTSWKFRSIENPGGAYAILIAKYIQTTQDNTLSSFYDREEMGL